MNVQSTEDYVELTKNAIIPKEAIHDSVRVVSYSYQIILVKVDYDRLLGCDKIIVLISMPLHPQILMSAL